MACVASQISHGPCTGTDSWHITAKWRGCSARRVATLRVGPTGQRRGTVGEPLHPPVHRHVVDVDAAFGKQFFDVAVGQPVAQIPAHRQRDHLGRETKPGEGRHR